MLNDTPLSDAAVEMNRYQRQQIVVEGDDIGQLPISGIYRAGSNEDFANVAVAIVYDLKSSAMVGKFTCERSIGIASTRSRKIFRPT